MNEHDENPLVDMRFIQNFKTKTGKASKILCIQDPVTYTHTKMPWRVEISARDIPGPIANWMERRVIGVRENQLLSNWGIHLETRYIAIDM